MWSFLRITCPNTYCKNVFGGGRGEIIGSLVSHIGVLYYCFEEILVAGKLSKVWYWYNKLGLRVRTYRDQYITWISFEE